MNKDFLERLEEEIGDPRQNIENLEKVKKIFEVFLAISIGAICVSSYYWYHMLIRLFGLLDLIGKH